MQKVILHFPLAQYGLTWNQEQEHPYLHHSKGDSLGVISEVGCSVEAAGSVTAQDCSTGGGAATTTVSLIMPVTSFSSSDIDMRTTISASGSLNIATQWTALALDHSTEDYLTAVLTATATTDRQTIVDISVGSGAITQIVGAAIGSPGTTQIIVTRDGEEFLFESVVETPTDTRLCVGDIRVHSITPNTDYADGIGGFHDSGYNNLVTSNAFLPNPKQTMSIGRLGFPFSNGVKVEQVSSVPITASAEKNKAVVCIDLTIPRGVS